jgi:hypothetical protein
VANKTATKHGLLSSSEDEEDDASVDESPLRKKKQIKTESTSTLAQRLRTAAIKAEKATPFGAALRAKTLSTGAVTPAKNVTAAADVAVTGEGPSVSRFTPIDKRASSAAGLDWEPNWDLFFDKPAGNKRAGQDDKDVGHNGKTDAQVKVENDE